MTFVWPTSHVGMLHPLAAVGSKAQKQGAFFLRMAEAAEKGVSYDAAKQLFEGVDQATVETRKSLYEELGLLYVPKYSGALHLTSVGKQLLGLLGTSPPTDPSPELRKRVDSLLCWAMTHTQIHRPQSFGSPAITEEDRASCDIRPYAAFWQAMFDLGGTITFDEFSQVMAHVHTVQDYLGAVRIIRSARVSGALPNAPDKSMNFGIYWRSHLTVADAVLQIENGIFTFAREREGIAKSILQFQMGCEGNDVSAAIRSKSWVDVEDYYSFAGEQCPTFIASGQATVRSFGGEPVVMLKGYGLEKDAAGYFVDAGMELCPLKLGMPCFHTSELHRILRIDQKTTIKGDRIRIRFGLGRPISNSVQLLQLWGEQ
jgi:hypothetical protein